MATAMRAWWEWKQAAWGWNGTTPWPTWRRSRCCNVVHSIVNESDSSSSSQFSTYNSFIFVTLRIEMIQILFRSWDATKKRYNCKMELHDLRATTEGKNEMNAKFNRTSLHCGPLRPTASNCHLQPIFSNIHFSPFFLFYFIMIFRIIPQFYSWSCLCKVEKWYVLIDCLCKINLHLLCMLL